ncbi:MAG: hypothetical protein Q8P18_23095 [Pseudomonadota bacterium]|nr:hypothetical protein [Pseudomonadota bacterium]
MLLLLLFACAGPGSSDSVSSDKDTSADTSQVSDSGDADTDTDTDTDTDVQELYGTPPASPVGLPTFTAHNQYGEARSEADLLGHPTVLWFYPAAGTYG